ncbi:MAG TPA: LolA-related protein [Gammaproteobacteria bacterium]|nr:LolA-related protein [Gammaproteobacteria bacterium]
MLTPRAWGDVADPEGLIHRLARSAPASVGFVEARYSSLLRTPILVSGKLAYLGPARLDRDVTAPYREHTAIRDESVSIEREGEQPRTLALRRAPELRGLLMGFAGVLAGDSAAVKRSFAIAAKGAEDAWTLELTPLDPGMQRRLERIVVTGAAGEPRCLLVFGAREAATVMLLGAAVLNLPADVPLAQLLEHCRAE